MKIRSYRNGAFALSGAALAIAASAVLAACSGHAGSAANSVVPSNPAQSGVKPNAVTNIYGGGSTLAALLYRNWMDYYGVAMPPDPQGAPNGQPVNPNFQYYYAAIGSGAGRQAFLSQTPSNAPPAPNPIYCPNAGTSCYPYPVWHWSGSDATFSSQEIQCYEVGCPPTYNAVAPIRGQYIQIPSLETDITVPYNPSGQTIGSKGLRFSRNTYCGIWEGAITSWADPGITQDNGGVVVSNQNITRVVRADSSGTTFLLTNHLNTVCQGLSNPSYDWTGGVGGTVNWPGGPVQAQTGSSGVVSGVQSTSGALGYVGPSYVAPIAPGGLPTASLQNQYFFGSGKAAFISPTVGSTLAALHGVNPPSNPNPWDLGILIPNPAAKTAYPIVGFTWLEIYQCYNLSSEAAGIKGFVKWYAQPGTVGTTPPDIILEAQGVSPMNSKWKSTVRSIVNNVVKGPINGTCTI